jgi:hypothetical protein
MKKILVCLMILFPTLVFAASLPVFETITVSTAAIGFTSTNIYSYSVTTATCTLETAQIRFRTDGTDPTSAIGHILEVGQSLCIGYCTGKIGVISNLVALNQFRAIRTGTVDGVLRCTYE